MPEVRASYAPVSYTHLDVYKRQLLDLLVVHHLAEVVFQRVLGEIRQGLVHCVVFLRRGPQQILEQNGCVEGRIHRFLLVARKSK